VNSSGFFGISYRKGISRFCEDVENCDDTLPICDGIGVTIDMPDGTRLTIDAGKLLADFGLNLSYAHIIFS